MQIQLRQFIHGLRGFQVRAHLFIGLRAHQFPGEQFLLAVKVGLEAFVLGLRAPCFKAVTVGLQPGQNLAGLDEIPFLCKHFQDHSRGLRHDRGALFRFQCCGAGIIGCHIPGLGRGGFYRDGDNFFRLLFVLAAGDVAALQQDQ